MNFGKKKQAVSVKSGEIGFEEAERLIAMTPPEYQQMIDQIAEQERRIEEQEQQIKALQRQCGDIGKIRDERDAAVTQNAALEEKNAELEITLRYEREHVQKYAEANENLFRINRERANAARGLRPKKKHTGYVLLWSEERKIGSTKKWESRIQTPYSCAEYSAAQVRKLVAIELLEQAGLVSRLGLPGKGAPKRMSPEERANMTEYLPDDFLRADYRVGYWEVTLWHDKQFAKVPEDMLPQKKDAPENGAGK